MKAMSDVARQTFIDAPVGAVWDLISDVNRHPEWWPRIVEVHCEGLEEGCTYREVVKAGPSKQQMELSVDELSDCENLAIRCLNTGTFVHFSLTEAQGGTFVDGRMGMDPKGVGNKVFDLIVGQRYFRNWLEQTLEALDAAACRRARQTADSA